MRFQNVADSHFPKGQTISAPGKLPGVSEDFFVGIGSFLCASVFNPVGIGFFIGNRAKTSCLTYSFVHASKYACI